MLIMKLFYFITGYVQFTATGGFPERFINLCTRYRVNIRSLQIHGNTVTACTSPKHYKKIRIPAHRSGMRVRIKRKGGLPFFIHRRRARSGLLAGAALGITVLCILSTRVWNITVVGNDRVPSDKILSVVESYGLKIGAPASRISAHTFQSECLDRLPDLSWIYVNVIGCKAQVEVRETRQTEEAPSAALCDLVSAASGTLVTLRVFDGTPCAKIGSGVLKGDVLISGVEENKDGSDDICGARGYAEATTRSTLQGEAKKGEVLTRQSLQKTGYALKVLCFTLPLGKRTAPNTQCFTEDSYLELNGTVLPFGICRYYNYALTEQIPLPGQNDLSLWALSRFFASTAQALQGAEIQLWTAEVHLVGKTAVAKGDFQCLQNIGILREMELLQTDNIP